MSFELFIPPKRKRPGRPVGSIRIKLADINPPELLDKIEREAKEELS